jgi:hypothetical protein
LLDMIEHLLAALELAGELMLRHAKRDSLPVQPLEGPFGRRTPGAHARRLTARADASEIAKDDLEALVLFATCRVRELGRHAPADRGDRALVPRRRPRVRGSPVDEPPHAARGRTGGNIAQFLHESLACRRRIGGDDPLVGALSPHARDAGGCRCRSSVSTTSA